MEKEIHLKDGQYTYELRRSARSRRARITVSHEQKITVTLPRRAAESMAEVILREKENWLARAIERFRALPSLPDEPGSYELQKENARVLIERKISQWNSVYGANIKGISIRDQKTRWGSASPKGNLSFNFRVVYLPERLVDYLVVHEICHLTHMNHSRAFWRAVSRAIPDWKACRKEMRGYARFGS